MDILNWYLKDTFSEVCESKNEQKNTCTKELPILSYRMRINA